jgi:hypothetical protein
MIENKKKMANSYGKSLYRRLCIMATMKKLYYAPGMISLLGLLFILPYKHDIPVSAPVRTIDYNVPRKIDSGPYEGFSVSSIQHEIKGKAKMNFRLTGDSKTNRKKMEVIRYEARKLYYTFNTNTIIFIKFTEDLPYADFFKLLDNCRADSIKRFANWDDCFVIFGWNPPPKREDGPEIQLITCGTFSMLENRSTKEQQKEKSLIKLDSMESMYLLGGWFLLLTSFLLFRKPPPSV